MAAAAFALAGIGTFGAILVASPGADEEVVQQVETPTESASASASATATQSPPPTEIPFPTATPQPVPDDWPTYSDPGSQFSIRYPQSWFQTTGQAQFAPYDLNTRKSISRPLETLVVEVNHYKAVGSSGCGGALSVDSESGEATPAAGATPSSLGGIPAWQMVRLPGDPAIEEPLTRIQGVSVVYNGYCFIVAGYFTQQDPDVQLFEQIAGSFRFTF